MEENLKRKTTKALVWSTADKLGQQLFYLVAGIILARQLSPEDYGKVGVLTIFIALSGILIDSGFSSALIRKKEATQADYSTVFYVNVAISCVLYGLLYAAAPYIAVFFKVPDLIYICRILFLVIPMNALSLIQQTLLLKHFKLSVSARVNLWSLGIASVVAIAMAYGGMGVWSLISLLDSCRSFSSLSLLSSFSSLIRLSICGAAKQSAKPMYTGNWLGYCIMSLT